MDVDINDSFKNKKSEFLKYARKNIKTLNFMPIKKKF